MNAFLYPGASVYLPNMPTKHWGELGGGMAHLSPID